MPHPFCPCSLRPKQHVTCFSTRQTFSHNRRVGCQIRHTFAVAARVARDLETSRHYRPAREEVLNVRSRNVLGISPPNTTHSPQQCLTPSSPPLTPPSSLRMTVLRSLYVLPFPALCAGDMGDLGEGEKPSTTTKEEDTRGGTPSQHTRAHTVIENHE